MKTDLTVPAVGSHWKRNEGIVKILSIEEYSDGAWGRVHYQYLSVNEVAKKSEKLLLSEPLWRTIENFLETSEPLSDSDGGLF